MEHEQYLANCHRHLGSPLCCKADICPESIFRVSMELAAEFQTGKELVLSYLGLLYGFYASSGSMRRVFFTFFGNDNGILSYFILWCEKHICFLMKCL